MKKGLMQPTKPIVKEKRKMHEAKKNGSGQGWSRWI